jgi:hypothetical protein
VNNQRTFIFLGIVVLLSICLGLFREPHYQGRSLTSWLQQYAYSAGNETQRLEQASMACLSWVGLHPIAAASWSGYFIL